MPAEQHASAMSAAASQLRAMIAASEEGAFLGGELELQKALGVSRTTLRQVARLLEREGALLVKRGASGGYFASRPSYVSIKAGLTAYLEILDIRIGELLAVASITWTETVRQATGLNNEASKAFANRLSMLVANIDPKISFRDLIKIEQGIRADLFELIDSPYLKLIFQVNIEFARRQFEGPGQLLDIAGGNENFVAAWRSAKLLELEAIATGDRDLGILAAERTRRVWRSMMEPRGE